MIKTILFLLAVVAAVAYPVHQLMQPPDFGVSPTHPIGDLAKVEEWVQRWDGYDRAVATVSDEESFDFGERFSGAKRIDYRRREQRENAYERKISLILDDSGRLQAIRAEFPSGTSDPRKAELTEEEVVWQVWRDVTAREPKFVRMSDDTVFHRDSFKIRGVQGTWTKNYKVPHSERSICDTVLIYKTGE